MDIVFCLRDREYEYSVFHTMCAKRKTSFSKSLRIVDRGALFGLLRLGRLRYVRCFLERRCRTFLIYFPYDDLRLSEHLDELRAFEAEALNKADIALQM